MNGCMDLNDTHIGYWYWWDGKVDPRSRSQGQRSRSQMHLCKIFVSARTHEWMIISWWYLRIWFILMRIWSWSKVKVTRSKVKVTHAFMENSCFSYKLWTDEWILMILTHMIDIDETVNLTQGQGHKVKGQGHICIYGKFLFRL